MGKLKPLCTSLCAMAFVGFAAPAQATSIRTWVSSSGADTGACPQTAPCATFAYALTQTAVSGEINCLSSGDFGTVTISASVTIDCGSNTGYIDQTANNAAAITITGGQAIKLRSLSLKGFGTGQAGINVTNAASNFDLRVEVCNISLFNNSGGSGGSFGILFQPGGSRSGLTVISSSIGVNFDGGGNGIGISATPGASGSILAINLIEDVLQKNDIGVSLTAGSGVIAGIIVDSHVTYNNHNGVQVSGTAFVTIDQSTIVDNLGTGVASLSSGAEIQVNNTTITGNGTGVSGSAVSSFVNNRLDLNGSNGSFGSTEPLQ